MAGVPGQRSGGANRKSASVAALEGTRPAAKPTLVLASRPAGGAVAIPAAPAGLSPESRRLWRRIHQEFEITTGPSLELLVSALRSRDLAERARIEIERDGLTVTDKAGQVKVHPLAAVQRDARAAFVTTMRVLGFPSEDR